MKHFFDRSPRILVIRAGAIGDTLMATPLLRALRQTYPNAYLASVCSGKAYDVLRFNPHLDKVFSLSHRHLPHWLSFEKQRLIQHFRPLELNSIISLETNPIFTKLSCHIGAERIITYGESNLCDNLETLDLVATEHSIETHLRAGESVGAKPAGTDMEFDYPPEIDLAVQKLLKNKGIGENDLVVGIHAGWGGRGQHPTDTRLRSWPADRFATVAGWLSESYGAKIVLTGSGTDCQLNEFIADSARVPCLNLAGQLSLLETAALIRRMNLYITIDSGPAHIAAALGTPLITLWGPGIITATAPISDKSPVKIIRSPPPCAPCYGTPLKKSCRDNICMKQIAVDDIINASQELLYV